MMCPGFIVYILFSFRVVHKIKVHIPPFGISDMMKCGDKDTYSVGLWGLSNATTSRGCCGKANNMRKDVYNTKHFQMKGLSSWLGVFSCFWDRAIFYFEVPQEIS